MSPSSVLDRFWETIRRLECSSINSSLSFLTLSLGKDVSRLVVDLRDDGDNALTFRSLFIGTCLTGLASAITIIYTFKPVEVSVSTVFIVLLCYVFGLAWSCLPGPDSVKNKPIIGRLEGVLRFLQSGEPFRIKEHVVASLIAASGSNGLAGVEAMWVNLERKWFSTFDRQSITTSNFDRSWLENVFTFLSSTSSRSSER